MHKLQLIFGIGVMLLIPLVVFAACENDKSQNAQLEDWEDVAAKEDSPLVSGIIGSAHDFSQTEAHPRDLCLPCHAPHLPVPPRPLWDRAPATERVVAPFAGYAFELDGASLLCLSCHDGVVASEVFTSSHATQLASQVGNSRLGYDGLQGHPVGVKYPVGDPKYHPAAAVTADGKIKLPGGRVQCTSCHDPHNQGGHRGLLVKSDERSRLCLSCHRL